MTESTNRFIELIRSGDLSEEILSRIVDSINDPVVQDYIREAFPNLIVRTYKRVDPPSPIPLWHAGFGAIVPHSSGISFTNQVGGTACYHPSIEGVFIPITEHPSDVPAPDDPLLDICWVSSENTSPLRYTPEMVENWLRHHGLQHWFSALPELRGAPWILCEAWVPVCIKHPVPREADHLPVALRPFRGQPVILTYHNSD